jgi:hypothetical protein
MVRVCFASTRKELVHALLLVLASDPCDPVDKMVKVLVRHALAHRVQTVGDLLLEELYLPLFPVSPLIRHHTLGARREGVGCTEQAS